MQGITRILEAISRQAEWWIVGLLAVLLLLILALISQQVRLSRLNRRLDRLTRGATGVSLEQALTEYLAQIDRYDTRMCDAERRCTALEDTIRYCLRYVGMVRYDAVEDMGGQQSFSLALMDDSDNGLLITNVTGRQSSRVYAKSIKGGHANLPLSPEEKQAITDALQPGRTPAQ